MRETKPTNDKHDAYNKENKNINNTQPFQSAEQRRPEGGGGWKKYIIYLASSSLALASIQLYNPSVWWLHGKSARPVNMYKIIYHIRNKPPF